MSVAAVDELPDVADSDTDPGGVCHITCKRCDPVPYPDMKAVCGEELLGIGPVWPDVCQACNGIWPDHVKNCPARGSQ